MFNNQFSREDIADVAVLLHLYRNGKKPSKAIYSISEFGMGRSWQTETQAISGIEPETTLAYLLAVAKRFGNSEAAELADKCARIDAIDGVEIRVETSDDDPMKITFFIQDEIASEWCDAHGSLAGGTWESADGPEFAYDITHWYPGLIDELIRDGYNFNLSDYSEPDEEEIAIAEHSHDCDECDHDFGKARDHVENATYHVIEWRSDVEHGSFRLEDEADQLRRNLYRAGNTNVHVERRTTNDL